MSPIHVLLVDDHTLVRAGFRAFLQDLPGVQVVGEAADGREALQFVEASHPDIVLMDISMPGLNGLEAVARMTRDYPQMRVIVLSMHDNSRYVLWALKAGAAGYLTKDSGTAELESALRTVARGQTYLGSAVSEYVDKGSLPHGPASPLEERHITPRQREVLQLIAEGHTTGEVAHILELSTKTVETHRAELMERLDIHSLAGLVRYAIEIGLVEIDV